MSLTFRVRVGTFIRHFLFLLVGVAAFLPVVPKRAHALPPFLQVAKKLYAFKDGGKLNGAGCNVCHAGGPPKLNPYGADVRAALDAAKTKTLTPEILQSIESKDSDGDGATNAAEFMADALPGDPNSKPAAAPDKPAPPAKDKPTTQDKQPEKPLVGGTNTSKTPPNPPTGAPNKPTPAKSPESTPAKMEPPQPGDTKTPPANAPSGTQVAGTQQQTPPTGTPAPAAAPPASVTPTAAPAAAASSTTDSPPGPWAIQTLLFPSHAQHPVIVHFPIALLLIGLFFDFMGVRSKNRSLFMAGYYNISAAALFAPVTVVTGLGAWWFKWGHAALQGNILYHLIMGITSMLIIWGLWFLRRGEAKSEDIKLGPAYIALGILAFPIIAITGHLGGILTSGG